MKFLLLGIITIVTFTKCKKVNDTEKPKISITSPINKDTLPVSQSEVLMQFTATDNKDLSSMIIDISDDVGNNYYGESKEIYGTTYTYKNSFNILVHPSKIKTLTMTVHILDQSKNETIESSTFFLSPTN